MGNDNSLVPYTTYAGAIRMKWETLTHINNLPRDKKIRVLIYRTDLDEYKVIHWCYKVNPYKSIGGKIIDTDCFEDEDRDIYFYDQNIYGIYSHYCILDDPKEPEVRYFTCCSDQGDHAKDETCDMWRAHQED